eukprot:NODE_11247_length_311_cov_19.694656_g10334_i0.p5 GENE.NODE_11247_length_311_cov_19.694656_g10334_i0~~NODE_11247_length_311_cov_19.694656_g10334_i0.p5  ORF type:complete len:57 (-),score=22.94 NODE_11247_length_311_cov_19.694656_g10334_i0:140-283(-)
MGFKSGIVCAGIGSKLLSKDAVENRPPEDLVATITQCRMWIAEVRGF